MAIPVVVSHWGRMFSGASSTVSCLREQGNCWLICRKSDHPGEHSLQCNGAAWHSDLGIGFGYEERDNEDSSFKPVPLL